MNKLFLTAVIILLTISLNAQNGILKTYHLSGKIEGRISYVNEILEGTSYWYYENGNLRSIKNYSNGKLNGISSEFYGSGLLKSELHIVDGMLHGVQRSYYANGGLKSVKNYDKGKLITFNKLDDDPNYIAPLSAYEAGKKKRTFDNTDFLCGEEICPEPVGGIEEIEKKIVYPELAKQFKLEGIVIISTIITKKGIPTRIEVIKDLGLGCSEAAVEAVKKTMFVPGGSNGDVVDTEVTFKLHFKLSEKSNLIAIKSQKGFNNSKLKKNQSPKKEKEFITCNVDACPKPNGGITELIKNLRYPPQARRKNITGDVIVKANVNDLGFVIKAEVIKKLGYGCDEAAKSLVIKTQFEPGKKNGIDTESIIEITIPFILD